MRETRERFNFALGFSEEEKEASLDMSKDVMLPGEMTFRREALTASTPAAALR